MIKLLGSLFLFSTLMTCNLLAQPSWIQVTKEDSKFGEYYPWVVQDGIRVPCPGNDCGHTNYVNYDVTETLLSINGHTYLGEWFHFTNPDPTCHAHFVVCSMVQYKRPFSGDSRTVTTHTWKITRHPSDLGGTFSKPCSYTCSEDPTTDQKDYWSFYFGCKEVDIPPGNVLSSQNAPFDGWIDITSYLPNGITLSNDKYEQTKVPPSRTSWNFFGQYTDFQEGCSVDASCAGLTNSPNHEVDEDVINGSKCASPDGSPVNGWHQIGIIDGIGGGGSPPLISKIVYPTGNQVTMATMNAYPATFRGLLINAPAGTELRFWVPSDTMSGMVVVDSGHIVTDTLSGCTSDTLGFSFPFLVPPMDTSMMDPGMLFQITIPNSCSNIGNGRRIELRSEIYARSTTPQYDSGAFMYWTSSKFIRDTTPPTISNFVLHQVDSNRLAIFLQGSEDTTMIDRGYIKYRVNGGSEQVMLLRYMSNDSVDGSTKFVDTLVTSVSHPQILLRGFVGNQLGLTDSTIMDTCQLIEHQANVQQDEKSSLQVEYLYTDHKTLNVGVVTNDNHVVIDIVTIDGKSARLVNQETVPGTEEKIVKSLSSFASGPYFIVIHAGAEMLVRRVIF